MDPEDGRIITDLTGRIDYVERDDSTLFDCHIYTPELIYRKKLNEEDYGDQVGYAIAQWVGKGFIDNYPEYASCLGLCRNL